MDCHTLSRYCLEKRGATESFPFGDSVRVFKVMNKVFALMPINAPLQISLKCEPSLAYMLRLTYTGVQPGYHLNKDHWNTVTCDGSIPDAELLGMIDHSYELVVKGLTRKDREKLAAEGRD
ncbi:MAG TPA: MmcQ/YjbR family DNA-binding protein [Aggregatilineales bacterium]|nr:MmcQ/YjbR family DNA-binding protein [Aggregatilineales bacterium]